MTAAIGLLGPGCDSSSPSSEPATVPGTAKPVKPADSEASAAIAEGLTKIINDENRHFTALDYEYDEDLLLILDRTEAYLSGQSKEKPPRLLPRLDEEVELAHLRETVRRWTAKTGKTLRPLVDTLKAEVAARKPGGPAFHPDFHRRFADAFDDIIPIEVAEIRERRNITIHQKAKSLLDPYRDKFPDLVKSQEQFLSQPPYSLPGSVPVAKASQ